MTLNISFNIDLTAEEVTLFKTILNCSTDQELTQKLGTIGKAALTEYNKMILGQRVFTRGKDILEFRLLNLIKHHFNGAIPSEQQISALFQITATESRALIRSITSKYQYELTDIINTMLKELLRDKTMKNADKNYKLPLDNVFFKDELNKRLGMYDNKLPMVEKDVTTNGVYTISISAYDRLCHEFQIAKTTVSYA